MSMKNKIIFLIILFCNCFIFSLKIGAEELDISALEITFHKDQELLIAEGSVIIVDSVGNKVTTEKAEYDKSIDQLITYQDSKIILKNGYQITSSDILYDNKSKLIVSNE